MRPRVGTIVVVLAELPPNRVDNRLSAEVETGPREATDRRTAPLLDRASHYRFQSVRTHHAAGVVAFALDEMMALIERQSQSKFLGPGD